MELFEEYKKFDPDNQFEVLKNSFMQIENAWNKEIDLQGIDSKKIKNIVVTGLGGSAISGDLILNFLGKELELPYYVNRNYTLPNFVNEETLLIASSYSGNTEETIAALSEGIAKKCQIVCVTNGGNMVEIADINELPVVELEPELQPRYAFYTSFFTLLKILQTLGLITNQDEIVAKIALLVRNKGEEYSYEGNPAHDFAEMIGDKIAIIYSASGVTDGLGKRFKSQLNENSKLHAFHNVYPEMNHNEIVGWETVTKMASKFVVINFVDEVDHPQVTKRFEIVNELIEDKGVAVYNLEGEQATFKERLFELVYSVDWITYYACVQRGMNPSEIDFIHHLKKELAE